MTLGLGMKHIPIWSHPSWIGMLHGKFDMLKNQWGMHGYTVLRWGFILFGIVWFSINFSRITCMFSPCNIDLDHKLLYIHIHSANWWIFKGKEEVSQRHYMVLLLLNMPSWCRTMANYLNYSLSQWEMYRMHHMQYNHIMDLLRLSALIVQ